MRMTPTQILKALGFDVPEEGVEIGEPDGLLMTAALRLAGATIDVDRIPDAKLAELHQGMAGLVSGWMEQGMIQPYKVNSEATTDSLQKLRSTLHVVLRHSFKLRSA